MDNQNSNAQAEQLDPNQPARALGDLERQIERGSLFTHTALGRNLERIAEVETFIYGLIDLLLARGVISPAEVSSAATNVREKMTANGELAGVGVHIRVEESANPQSPAVEVDCAARLHICHAACCKLDFALTTAEVESGTIKWDLGRPYLIRHESDGHCSHLNRGTGLCKLYSTRPAVCRNYNCAGDKRIWKDFEKMELNTEWISENLSPTRPRALRVLMNNVEVK